MATPAEGELTVRLAWNGRRVVRTVVESTRPFAVPRLLEGRAPREAAGLVPLLYSVCAFAQGSAAASALALASGHAVEPRTAEARELAVTLEAIGEDLRRLLVELPPVVGAAPLPAPVAAARKAMAGVLGSLRSALALDTQAPPLPDRETVVTLAASLEALLRGHVLGMSSEAFLALRDVAAVDRWAATTATAAAGVLHSVLAHAPDLGASDVRAMPTAGPADLDRAVVAALDADRGFARAPSWHGEPVTTGALARAARHPAVAALVARHGAGVAARLYACLVDLAQTVAGVAAPAIPQRLVAWSPRAGDGVAAVATARGLLVHRARVADGRIVDHLIVAPTEWNFHPRGALTRALDGRAAADESALMRDANLVVRSLDPCVACRVEIAHA